MRFTEAIRQFEGQPLTRQILEELLSDYRRPSDRISDLVKAGILTKVKAKVYVPGPALKMRGPEPMLLANLIASPSYVSMETALMFWQMIPERVYEYKSAISGRSVNYTTSVGTFRYTHIPLPYFAFGQISVELAPEQVALFGNAEKALCDMVVASKGLLLRSVAQTREWLLEDMRMDRDRLRELQTDKMKQWVDDAPKQDSLNWLIKTLDDL